MVMKCFKYSCSSGFSGREELPKNAAVISNAGTIRTPDLLTVNNAMRLLEQNLSL